MSEYLNKTQSIRYSNYQFKKITRYDPNILPRPAGFAEQFAISLTESVGSIRLSPGDCRRDHQSLVSTVFSLYWKLPKDH